MNCVICGCDNWENVDEFRIKPSGMSICKACGFLSYPSKWKTEEEIKAHYRKDYRQPPTAGNLFSGQRKLHFHNVFLNSVFKEWHDKQLEHPKVFEIGAAYGIALYNIKDQYPGAELFGSELTLSYRKNALEEFGLNLSEDFDFTNKYDLIISYKVAEHQLDIDQYLIKYKECLTENGYIYISVPTWFDSLINFGLGGFDLEYYYDTNHINVWTKKLFETLLKKCGLEIVKEDHIIYGSTYLCKRNDSLMKDYIKLSEENTGSLYENSDDIKEKLKKVKRAFIFLQDGKYVEAINEWKDFPIAHVNRAEIFRKEAFSKGWDFIKTEIIDFGFKCCPTSAEIYSLAADFAMRANKYPEALKYLEDGLKSKPENPPMLMQLINIFREMALKSKNKEEKNHYFIQARNIARHLNKVSLQHMKESTDLIYLFNSHID